MERRGFLGSLAALAAVPVVAKAEVAKNARVEGKDEITPDRGVPPRKPWEEDAGDSPFFPIPRYDTDWSATGPLIEESRQSTGFLFLVVVQARHQILSHRVRHAISARVQEQSESTCC